VREGLVRLLQLPGHRERIALHNIVHEVKEIWHAQALEAVFGELNQGFGPVTDQVQHAGAQCLQPLVHQRFPRGVGAIVCYLFLHNVSGGHLLEDQYHLFQESFVHGPNNLAHLTSGNPILLPDLDGLRNRDRQGLHHTA
jgi:hypothetical protein